MIDRYGALRVKYSLNVPANTSHLNQGNLFAEHNPRRSVS